MGGRVGDGMGGMMGMGPKPSPIPRSRAMKRLPTIVFPDPNLEDRFAAADELLAARGDRYVQVVVWFTLFERLWMLRGFENPRPVDNFRAAAGKNPAEYGRPELDRFVRSGAYYKR